MAMNSGRSTVVGVFEARDDAERAVDELQRAGFRDEHIGFARRDERETGGSDVEGAESMAGEGATTGALTGGMIGGLIGAAAAGLIPGIGPVIAGGILAATLGGAAVGAAAGGLLGALTGMGVPEDEARYYEGEFQSGRTLVTVRADGRYQEASSILRRYGAYDVDTQATRGEGARRGDMDTGADDETTGVVGGSTVGGAIGGVAGAALGGPVGLAAGAALGGTAGALAGDSAAGGDLDTDSSPADRTRRTVGDSVRATDEPIRTTERSSRTTDEPIRTSGESTRMTGETMTFGSKGGAGQTDVPIPRAPEADVSRRDVVETDVPVRRTADADVPRRDVREIDVSGREARGADVDVTTRRGDEAERTVQLREEELSARKQTVETGRVEVRKDVVQEERTVEVPVSREEVTVERRPTERRPSDRPVGAGGEVIDVPVHGEQVDVEKQAVVYEELEVDKRSTQRTERVSDTVRREVADVRTEGEPDVGGTGGRPTPRR